MLLGAHESIAGGASRAFERGRKDGCEALQIFTKSGRGWAAPPLAREEVARFRAEATATGWPVLVHDSYLINLAAEPGTLVFERSREALYEELARCEELGAHYLVMHPGAHGGAGEEAGLARLAGALGAVLRRARGFRVRALLEITAGQGSSLGHRFEHIAFLLRATEGGERLGVCFDTCHAYAAGYDLRDPHGYEATIAELDRRVGLDRVLAFHLNDCKKPLGCRVDRHERIGEGTLGLEPFARLVNDPRFARCPGVLETPPLPDGTMSFADGLARLKTLRDRSATATEAAAAPRSTSARRRPAGRPTSRRPSPRRP